MPTEAEIEAKAQALHTHIFSQPPSTFTNNPWAIIAAMEDFATTNHMMIFRAPKISLVQAHLTKMNPSPKTLIEFGTYVGTSALAWGAILRDLNPAQETHVYTFELSATNARISRAFIQLAGLEDSVHVIEGLSSESLRGLHAEGKLGAGGVDVAFFDHWEKFYVSDLKICEELGLFRLGSVAVADNTDFPGAPDYLRYVRGEGEGGDVRYETRSLEADVHKGCPSIVEISTVV